MLSGKNLGYQLLAMKLSTAGYLLALLLPAALGSQQKVLGGGSDSNRNSPLDSGFERFAIDVLEEWHVPGIAISVVDGKNSWAAVSVKSYLTRP
jgi:hypothetical protein